MGNARLGIKNYIFGIDSLSLHEGRSVFVVVFTQPIISTPPTVFSRRHLSQTSDVVHYVPLLVQCAYNGHVEQ